MVIPLFLFFSYSALLNAQLNFTSLPSAAQPCLNLSYTKSGCPTVGTDAYLNACICANGGNFLALAATCVFSNDRTEIGAVYGALQNKCQSTGTPIIYTWQQFVDTIGHDGQASTLASTTTEKEKPATGFSISTTSSSTSPTSKKPGIAAAANTSASPSDAPHNGKYSESDIIALGVGIPSVVFAALACVIGCICCNR